MDSMAVSIEILFPPVLRLRPRSRKAIDECDHLILPMHIGGDHWVVAAADLRRRPACTLYVVDSAVACRPAQRAEATAKIVAWLALARITPKTMEVGRSQTANGCAIAVCETVLGLVAHVVPTSLPKAPWTTRAGILSVGNAAPLVTLGSMRYRVVE